MRDQAAIIEDRQDLHQEGREVIFVTFVDSDLLLIYLHRDMIERLLILFSQQIHKLRSRQPCLIQNSKQSPFW